ncbi:MAG TPA: UvrB/UvrC motif-containing protein [Caulobacteraceae bacterium]|jgi:hypothetical protein
MAADTEDDVEALRRAMAEAVAAEDYEAAAALRDRLKAAEGGRSRVRRPEPGAMGLGTERPAHVPPAGWVKPARPDPMTAGNKRGGRRRKP